MAKATPKKAAVKKDAVKPKPEVFPFGEVYLRKQALEIQDKRAILALMQEAREKTATKAVLFAVHRHAPMLQQIRELNQGVQDRDLQISKLQQKLRDAANQIRKVNSLQQALSEEREKLTQVAADIDGLVPAAKRYWDDEPDEMDDFSRDPEEDFED